MSDENSENSKTETNANVKTEKEVFSKEYVSELRAENAKWRTNAENAEKTAKKALEDQELNFTEMQKLIESSRQEANSKILYAELKSHALAAGMIDVDGLKLADLSAVKINESGEVEGVNELMKQLKESKPYLFKEFKHSSSVEKFPDNKKAETKINVMDMTKEQYAAYRRTMVK